MTTTDHLRGKTVQSPLSDVTTVEKDPVVVTLVDPGKFFMTVYGARQEVYNT